MATILQLKVTKRRLFEKVSLERWLIQHTFQQWLVLGRLPFVWTCWISCFYKLYNMSALPNWDLFLAKLKDYQFAHKQLSKFGRNGMSMLLTGWLGLLVPNNFPWLHEIWYWVKCFCFVLCSKSPSSQINKGIRNFDLYHPNLWATCFWLLESKMSCDVLLSLFPPSLSPLLSKWESSQGPPIKLPGLYSTFLYDCVIKSFITKLCLLIFFIDRILQNENPYPRIFDDPVIQLFGAKFVKANALTQHMETLFFLLRYKILNLDNFAI